MSDVKRYLLMDTNIDAWMEEDCDGDYVKFDDHERAETARGHLQKRCKRYEAENKRLRAIVEKAWAGYGGAAEDWECDCRVCTELRDTTPSTP